MAYLAEHKSDHENRVVDLLPLKMTSVSPGSAEDNDSVPSETNEPKLRSFSVKGGIDELPPRSAATSKSLVPKRRSWCDTTTFHGWHDWAHETNGVLKTIWTILLLFACIMLIYALLYTTRSYNATHNWSTTSYYDTREIGFSFPIITICNYNRIARSKVEAYKMPESVVKLILQHFPVSYFYRNGASSTNYSPNAVEEYVTWKEQYNFTLSKLLKTLGHSCKDTFIQVWRNDGEHFRNMCEDEHSGSFTIRSVLNAEFGNCFQLNTSGITDNTTHTGSLGALKIALDTMTQEYLPLIEQNYLQEGFALQLSFDGQINFGNWISVTPGTYTKLAMSRQQMTLKDDSFPSFHITPPPCKDTVTHTGVELFPNWNYTRELCEQVCWLHLTIRECGCAVLTETSAAAVCELEDYHRCILNSVTSRRGEEKSVHEEFNRCSQLCPHECHNDRVSVLVSTTKLLSKAQSHLPNHFNYSYQLMAENFVVLDIYYNSLLIEVIELYETVTVDQLLGTIGGQLGIWAGVSVLTVAHAIVHFVLWLCRFVKRR